MELKFRTLRADEIELRVGRVMEGKATILLYKDARCDMNILDETVGAMNWKREHSRDNANCTVSIWDGEKQQWVGKEDTGTESNTEKEKGLASDSFKRSCTNWGIGRELYSAPKISIRCPTKERTDKRGYELVNRFQFYGVHVQSIKYSENREITELSICDQNGNVIWTNFLKEEKPNKAADIAKTEEQLIAELHDAAMEEAEETPKDTVARRLAEMDEASRAELLQPVDQRCIRTLMSYAEELKVPIERIASGYGEARLEELNRAEYADAIERLSRLKDKRSKNNRNVIVVKEG